MTPELRQKLTDLAQPAHPDQAGMDRLVAGWDAFFTAQGILPREEDLVFTEIMAQRVRRGSISIVSPKPDRPSWV